MDNPTIANETAYSTTRCPACGTERENIEGDGEPVVFCCDRAVETFRVRVVTTLSDGRAVETIIEDGQPQTTRWVGQSDG